MQPSNQLSWAFGDLGPQDTVAFAGSMLCGEQLSSGAERTVAQHRRLCRYGEMQIGDPVERLMIFSCSGTHGRSAPRKLPR